MPARCPSCGKQFKDITRVRKHLNHPYSRCSDYVPQNRSQGHPTRRNPHSGTAPIDDTIMDYEDEIDDASHPGIAQDITPDPETATEVSDQYHGSAKILAAGQSFMDRFDQDPYAAERQENLYYPFSSKDEWEMASFLLRSGLSMKDIDEFLKLTMVSSSHPADSTLYLNFVRFKGCVCRSTLPKPFVAVLKCFQKFHNGTLKSSSSLAFQQKTPWSFIIETLSNVSNICSGTHFLSVTWTITHVEFTRRLSGQFACILNG